MVLCLGPAEWVSDVGACVAHALGESETDKPASQALLIVLEINGFAEARRHVFLGFIGADNYVVPRVEHAQELGLLDLVLHVCEDERLEEFVIRGVADAICACPRSQPCHGGQALKRSGSSLAIASFRKG